jgi:hypothetical protein
MMPPKPPLPQPTSLPQTRRETTMSDHDHLEPEPPPGSAFKPCEQCNKPVDTREPDEGGDQHGAELYEGKWACSFECWDKSAGSLNPETTLAEMSDDELRGLIQAAILPSSNGHRGCPEVIQAAMDAEHEVFRRFEQYHKDNKALRDELERVKAERDELACRLGGAQTRVKRLKTGYCNLHHALSRIDYAMSESNEYECSLYDVDCDEKRVVDRVVKLVSERDKIDDGGAPR